MTLYTVSTGGIIQAQDVDQVVNWLKNFMYNVSDYGAKGDGKTVTDGAITTGTPTLTSASAAFTSADVGKQITVNGAAAAGANLNTTISAYVNATTVTLAANAGTTVSAATVFYATDDSTAISSARSAANAAGGGTVFYPFGTYLTGNQPLYPNVYDLGAGIGATTIKLKSGSNTDLFSAQTSLINLSAVANSGSVGTLHNFGFSGMTLDGNKANQTSGTSYPLRFYGYNFILRDLEVMNGYTGGYLSDWNGGFGIASPSDQMESLIDTCKFHDNNGVGFQYSGPHDSRMTNVLSFANGSHNFHLCPNANGVLMSNCHGYSLPDSDFVCSFLLESATGFNAMNCIAEGGIPTKQGYAVVVLGNLASWVSGGIWNGSVGMQLGQAAGQTPFPGQINQSAGVSTAIGISGGNIDTIVANCTVAGLKFANEANNKVDANIYQTAGSYISGTPATSDTYRINGTGLAADGTLAKSGGMQIVSSANPAFMIKDNSGGTIFHIDGSTGGTSGVNVPGGFHTTAAGGAAFNTAPNSGVSLLIAAQADASKALLLYPNSATQSANMLTVQDSGSNDTFTVDLHGNGIAHTLSMALSGTSPNPGNNGTVSSGIGIARVTPAANITGCILQTGQIATGQEVWVVNESASFSLSWATQATSHIAGEAGGTFVLSANRAQKFVWDNSVTLWFKAS